MRYVMGFSLALALALPTALGMPMISAAQAQTIGVPDPQQAAIDALTNSLIAVMDQLPANSPQNVYAAEFALRVDRASNLECPKILIAVKNARLSPKMNVVSLKALKSLSSTLAICRSGTGAGPAGAGNGLGVGPLPGFSLGGGTDYTS